MEFDRQVNVSVPGSHAYHAMLIAGVHASDYNGGALHSSFGGPLQSAYNGSHFDCLGDSHGILWGGQHERPGAHLHVHL